MITQILTQDDIVKETISNDNRPVYTGTIPVEGVKDGVRFGVVGTRLFIQANVTGRVTAIGNYLWHKCRDVGRNLGESTPVEGLKVKWTGEPLRDHLVTRTEYGRSSVRSRTVTEAQKYRVGDNPTFSYREAAFEFSVPGLAPVVHWLRVAPPLTGLIKLTQDAFTVSGVLLGEPYSFTLNDPAGRSWYDSADYFWPPSLVEHLRLGDFSETTREDFIAHVAMKSSGGEKGVAATLKKKDIAPNLSRLAREEPSLWTLLEGLKDGDTRGGVSNNQMLAVFLSAHGTSYDALVKGLRDTARGAWYDQDRLTDAHGTARHIAECLPGVRPWLLAKLRTKAAARARLSAATNSAAADLLSIPEQEYPLLYKAVSAGDIPRGVFNQPGKEGQPVNREWAIWEKALGRKGWAKVIFEICANASRRSTYERDITPYLAFLFKIEGYLGRHTEGRKKWSAMPKFVDSQWELEMDEATSGTTKRRSALTPEADNESRTITVPYTAMSVDGMRTTWCYSRHYHVFEEGLTDPESEGIVVRDLEPKLNGKDDYGLMFYTLTGSVTNRGYPTFLIIFERRVLSGTFVHFHRVHPCRSKKGVNTPACNLIEACYQYMAGNVPASEVVAQQGDLIFLRATQPGTAVKDAVPVSEFESHRFVAHDGTPVKLWESTAKQPSNRLGYIQSPGPFAVRHPEHDDIGELPGGTYEVRRCKSYENNPSGVWSLTID